MSGTWGVERLIRFLSSDVFERRTSTGSEHFSHLICLNATIFVLLGFFTLIETICPKILQSDSSRVQKVHFRLTCIAQKRCCLNSLILIKS